MTFVVVLVWRCKLGDYLFKYKYKEITIEETVRGEKVFNDHVVIIIERIRISQEVIEVLNENNLTKELGTNLFIVHPLNDFIFTHYNNKSISTKIEAARGSRIFR